MGTGRTKVGAAGTSVGASPVRAEGDGGLDGLADGVGVELRAVADGTPARTPSPGVGRRPVESVERMLPSQLEPMATDPARSTSAAAATA